MSEAVPISPRAIDHCVLPVADLDAASRRYAALGFTVAPMGVHPFGTANACVYFDDGCFLEPLAVADSGVAEAAARAGNVFVARDRLFRAAVGEEGFSAIVFATDDAEADHARFQQAGVSIGDLLDFSRNFVTPAGQQDRASFKLAFAGQPETDTAFFFTCQRIAEPNVDRSALKRHDNGVTGISGVVMASPDPQGDAALLASIAGGEVERDGSDRAIRLPGATIVVTPSQGLARLEAIRFRTRNLAAAARTAAAGGIATQMVSGRLVVAAGEGQGAQFEFEEDGA